MGKQVGEGEAQRPSLPLGPGGEGRRQAGSTRPWAGPSTSADFPCHR